MTKSLLPESDGLRMNAGQMSRLGGNRRELGTSLGDTQAARAGGW